MTLPNYYELKPIFDCEETCIMYLYEHGILYKELKCPKHKKIMSRYGCLWHCTKYGCSKKFSILKDSFFADSKLKVNIIMYMIYLKLTNTPSSAIKTITGHSSATVALWLEKYRQLISHDILTDKKMIGGVGITVEIDETLISRRRNPWTQKTGVWVFGGIERTEEKHVFAEMVPDRTKKTLLKLIKDNIRPGSIIISDSWAAYNDIKNALQMDHMTVDHSKHFKNPENGAHTNNIESSWNILKKNIPNCERIPEKVDNYIFEFIWKRQNKNNIWETFIKCLAETSYQ
jgi:ISXO2-like transposase domain